MRRCEDDEKAVIIFDLRRDERENRHKRGLRKRANIESNEIFLLVSCNSNHAYRERGKKRKIL